MPVGSVRADNMYGHHLFSAFINFPNLVQGMQRYVVKSVQRPTLCFFLELYTPVWFHGTQIVQFSNYP